MSWEEIWRQYQFSVVFLHCRGNTEEGDRMTWLQSLHPFLKLTSPAGLDWRDGDAIDGTLLWLGLWGEKEETERPTHSRYTIGRKKKNREIVNHIDIDGTRPLVSFLNAVSFRVDLCSMCCAVVVMWKVLPCSDADLCILPSPVVITCRRLNRNNALL